MNAGLRLLISLAVFAVAAVLLFVGSTVFIQPFALFDRVGPFLLFLAGAVALAIAVAFHETAWKDYGEIADLRREKRSLQNVIKQQYKRVIEAAQTMNTLKFVVDRTMTILMGKTNFKIGDPVRKIKGSDWQGKVVGFYSTQLTPIGYAIESFDHPGSVQIYPESALEHIPVDPDREV